MGTRKFGWTASRKKRGAGGWDFAAQQRHLAALERKSLIPQPERPIPHGRKRRASGRSGTINASTRAGWRGGATGVSNLTAGQTATNKE